MPVLTTDPRARRVAAARSGWSLIELLVATALGVVLMTAVAQSARMFATNVTETRNVGDTTIEEAIVTLTDDVRQAWTVARPGSSQLTLTDPYGSVTTYFLDKGCLKVRRPSGIDGSILDGVMVEERVWIENVGPSVGSPGSPTVRSAISAVPV